MAKEYFDEWFPGAMRKYDFVKFGIEKGHLKETAFELHQTAESLYHCVLLVVTFYTPHVHNLGFLRTQAERLDRRLVDTWPHERNTYRTIIEKLKEAYVKARYSNHYLISAEQLEWISARLEALGMVINAIGTGTRAATENVDA